LWGNLSVYPWTARSAATVGDMPVQILLVDDDADLRSMARYMLQGGLADLDYEITEAVDGHAALAVCADRRMDLVVLDMDMTGISGHVVLDTLKNAAESPCVIAWSSDGDALTAATRSGADAVVLKNWDVDLLVAAVNDCLSPN
jgi:two-component system, chemotaxis family, chemotaxis protein CheY